MAFDHWVHHRDRKSGKINRVASYRRLCIAGITYYERDSKWFDGAGAELPGKPNSVKLHDEAAEMKRKENFTPEAPTRSPLAQVEMAKLAAQRV